MNRRSAVVIPAVTMLGLTLMPSSTIAQQGAIKEQLVGTWELVSTSGETADGNRMEAPFGQKPLGYLMFSPSGHFSYNWVLPDRPKFASNNRQAGSPEENQAAVHGNLSAFGTYTISPDGSLTLQIVGSSFPNWNGTTQKRTVEIGGDQMKFTSPATSVGGRAVLMLSRAK